MAENQPSTAAPSTHNNPTGGDPGPARAFSQTVTGITSGPTSFNDAELIEAAKLLEGQPAGAAAPAEGAPAAAASAEAAPPAEAAAPAAKPEPASRGWAAVKEEEKRLRMERDRIDAEVRAIAEEKQRLAATQQQSGDLAAQLKRDPFGTLQRLGMPFEAIADMAIRGESTPAAVAPAAQSAAPQQDEITKLRAEIQAVRQESFLKDYRTGLERELADPKYALLRSYPGAAEEAMRLAGRYAQQTGKLLQPHEVSAMMQDAYREQLRSLSSHQAVQEVLGIAPKPAIPPAPAPASAPPAASAPPKQPAARTITQSMAATTPPGVQRQRPLTEAEILADAMQHIPKDADLWGHN